jgi:hypothetical protein
MIILDATTRKLQVVLTGTVTTNQLPCVASYVDVTTTAYTPGSNNLATNNSTAVDIVAAPAASTQRQVKMLTVQNADTVTATVSVLYNDNGTTRVIFKAALASGSILTYTDGKGFTVIDSSGSILQSSSLPMSALGDTIYGGTSGATTKLSGNITTTKKFLRQTGDGSASAAPAWDTVTAADIGQSNFKWVVESQVIADATDLDTSSGIQYLFVPAKANGMNLVRAQAFVATAGTTNATTIQVRNLTKYSGNDALSGAISIASGDTVGTAGTVNTSYDDVATDDKIKVYVTGQSTTKPKGFYFVLEYQTP